MSGNAGLLNNVRPIGASGDGAILTVVGGARNEVDSGAIVIAGYLALQTDRRWIACWLH